MMRRENSFVTDRELIVVDAFVTGPRGGAPARFVLDTGAAVTTIVPELADRIGYSARDGYKRTKVRTAIGEEEAYILRVAELTVLGFTMPRFPVHVFDLAHGDLAGLLGLNFLNDFNYDILSAEQRILVEKIAPWRR
jgi:clan AA aspartic protease (TIGR02281 family)